jgi:hypothetical protein
MPTGDIPMILAVDDKPDDLRNTLNLGLGDKARGEVLHPRDVVLQSLEQADLVLVDYRIQDWQERDGVAMALQPVSGLALAVLLREHVDRSKQDRLTAFALHSAHLDEVRGRLSATSSEHVIARLNNLEWAFPKTNGSGWEQMIVLAEAVRNMPRRWPEGDPAKSAEEAQRLLGLDQECDWFERAWRDVRRCQPPIHHLSDGAHGLLFVRWLLHQILPYPTFLWREEWVAARLRITTDCLQKVLQEAGGKLAADLAGMTYRGSLCGFLGPRGWRAGLEEYVWQITDGKALDVDVLHEAIRARTGVPVEALPAAVSMVCLSPDLVPTGVFIAPDAGVRIRPDQWPPYADDAWTSVALAKSDAGLAAIVDPIDQVHLEEDGGR